MDRFLITLWRHLLAVRVYHGRFEGDPEPANWVQWGDIEQVIADAVDKRLIQQAPRKRPNLLFPDHSPEVVQLRTTIAQLRHRLQTRDEDIPVTYSVTD